MSIGVKQKGTRIVEEVRPAGVLAPWGAEWLEMARPLVEGGLRYVQRCFQHHEDGSALPRELLAHWPGYAAYTKFLYLWVPEETPGVAPSGYVPMWEDEVALLLQLEALSSGTLSAVLLNSGRAILVPSWDGMCDLANYLAVRNLLDRPWMTPFRAAWPDAHMRRLFALAFCKGWQRRDRGVYEAKWMFGNPISFRDCQQRANLRIGLDARDMLVRIDHDSGPGYGNLPALVSSAVSSLPSAVTFIIAAGGALGAGSAAVEVVSEAEACALDRRIVEVLSAAL